MKRKVLPEEKALRDWMAALPTLRSKPAGRKFYADIRVFGRAVREECAKVAFPGGECGGDTDYGRGWDAACRNRAAAIREGGK